MFSPGPQTRLATPLSLTHANVRLNLIIIHSSVVPGMLIDLLLILNICCSERLSLTIVRSSLNLSSDSYVGVFKSFRTGHLKRELQMLQLSAARCSSTAIL
jgi:hypothetical protein